ncbi:beta-N-acetylhexosaminidase [Thaumasiovibrio sp. DFM-14]|uniref:beta-N-acetylhexosaminidase n=1 Tax=Thaumasiovibrio sp. DFM-14 TaxID=3384792 RepID=UPI0039A278A8
MSNYVLNFIIHENREQYIKFSLELCNNSAESLNEFVLCLSMPRFINADRIINGTVIKQIGSHIELAPPISMVLQAGEVWQVTLETETSALYNLMERPIGAYLRIPSGTVVVEEGVNNMPQPHDLLKSKMEWPLPISGIIPQPEISRVTPGFWMQPSSITSAGRSPLTEKALDWFSLRIKQRIPEVVPSHAIVVFEEDETLDREGYRLDIGVEQVVVTASGSAGYLYALVSLAHLLETSAGRVACGQIVDKPRFSYRGQFLDCARSFFTVDSIKQLLDQMVWLKLNVFHWHLTDDEGWRIEIDAYPQLTQVGGWRGESEVLAPQFGSGPDRSGGYYTKAQIREIIQYAAEREITIIPEIDIPGHARALIQSLPEQLIEKEDESQYVSIQQYQDNVLNPGLVGTYQVLETILAEVCELFPSQVIHLGGDEVPQHVWEKSPACHEMVTKLGLNGVRDLEGHLIKHLQNYLSNKNKQLAVWEEAAKGDKADTSAMVYAWSGRDEGIKAAQQGHNVVMCPAQYTYLDMAWNNDIHEYGVLWANALDLKRAYHFEITEGVESHRVLGTQALVWSEYVKDTPSLEYLLYPRLFAIAENAWSMSENKDWAVFTARVSSQLELLKGAGIQYRTGDR